jgi:DNA-binding beta-propeller fold protein YncE
LAESISIAISPDDRSVYATSGQHAVVAVLARDPATGALRQLPGAAGCLSAQPGPGACPTGRAPEEVTTSVVVSPDGRNVYAASDREGVDSVAIFTRDPSTGALAHNHGRSGCVAQDRRAGCLRRKALRYITDLAISPDGRDLYVATGYPGPGAVAIFERRPSGALAQQRGRAGCVSENGSHGDCRKERALSQSSELAVSPDGGNIYVASLTGLSILVRHQSGALTQDPGKRSCISSFNRKCQRARAIEGATGVAVSPDAADVYVTSVDFNSVVALRR